MGAPVAIGAAMLAGFGFPPLTAAGVGDDQDRTLAPQSLALATAATGTAGSEGEPLRRVAGIVLVLSLGFAVYVMAQLYLFPWTIPG